MLQGATHNKGRKPTVVFVYDVLDLVKTPRVLNYFSGLHNVGHESDIIYFIIC